MRRCTYNSEVDLGKSHYRQMQPGSSFSIFITELKEMLPLFQINHHSFKSIHVLPLSNAVCLEGKFYKQSCPCKTDEESTEACEVNPRTEAAESFRAHARFSPGTLHHSTQSSWRRRTVGIPTTCLHTLFAVRPACVSK